MKKALLLFIVFSHYLVASAVNYDYLTFEQTDGKNTSLPTDGLTITFDNGNLIASDGTTIALSNISKMYFSNTSSINNQAYTAFEGPVEIYTVAGSRVGTFDSDAIHKAQLSKGVYLLIPSKGKATKIVIK